MHAHQFILVKEGDEFVWDYLVKAIQETADLFPDGLGHTHLCHKLHILFLYVYREEERGGEKKME